MLRAGKLLLFIFIGVVIGGCGQNFAAPPAASSNTVTGNSVHTSINLDEARARFAAAIGAQRTSTTWREGKSLDDQIKINQELVKINPRSVSVLNRLAYIYIRKVRQTADFSYNISAEKLLQQALKIEPNNYDSLLFLSMVYMAQHRFTDSRDMALKAISVNSYGAGAYGILGDSYFELGSYAQCAEAYDKMGDLRPGAPYYVRIAWYRNLSGDSDGAIEAIQEAFEASDPSDLEDHSWYLVQLANFAFDSGKTGDAEKYFQQSLQKQPASYNALAGLARVKVAQGKLKEAIALYEKAIAIVPMPEFAAALGDVYASMGQNMAAEKQYSLVEYIGLISKVNREIYNRQLALFYADHDRKLEEALKLAQNEIAIRKDIYGYDALAWCLYKNGKIQDAAKAMNEALRMGTRDAKLSYHAGMIYSAAGRAAEARKFLKTALAIQPHFHPLYAKQAAELLRKMS